MMQRLLVWGTVIVPAALVSAGIHKGQFPLGVPREWEWSRIEPTGDSIATLAGPVIFAAMMLAFVWAGAQRLERARRLELWAWLCGLASLAFGWMWVAQEAAPQGFGLAKAAWVLYYPGSSGYFTQARYHVRGAHELLQRYEQQMAQGDVLHIGTHPPGLIVGYRALMFLVENAPQWTAPILETRPEGARQAFQMLAINVRQSGQSLTVEDQAVLWLAALSMQAFAAAAVLPLFGVLRQCGSRRAAWLAASFWPFVPAISVFLPKSDAMYPFWGLLILWLWHEGWKRRSLRLCGAAGFVLWIGLFMTLAFLPVVLFAAIRTCCEEFGSRLPFGGAAELANSESASKQCRLRGNAALLGCAAAAFFLPVLMILILNECNLITVWSWNFRNHAAFYSQFQRTYWKWLLANPLELAIAAGIPLSVLAGWSVALSRKCWNRQQAACAMAAGLTWGILLVSGKNMGEAARLWIGFMPWLIVTAAPLFERAPPARSWPIMADHSSRMAIGLLALQIAFCLSITVRVVGFHPG